jgi:hypothetical protein
MSFFSVENSSSHRNYYFRNEFIKIKDCFSEKFTGILEYVQSGISYFDNMHLLFFWYQVRNFKLKPRALFFIFFFPVITTTALYGLVGRDPFNLSLGIVDHGEISLKNNLLANEDWDNFGNLSCKFIEMIDREHFSTVSKSILIWN